MVRIGKKLTKYVLGVVQRQSFGGWPRATASRSALGFQCARSWGLNRFCAAGFLHIQKTPLTYDTS